MVGDTSIGRAPQPFSGITCGLPAALYAILSDALLPPVAVGVNPSVTVHFCPAGTAPGETGHDVLTILKSPGLVPMREMPVIGSGIACRFLIVMVVVADGNPANVVGKS